ncbi:hypothetical protein Pint_34618 [Pistacia integerrima]|uniref:Uncharacterized protein n=1 Tax=Pistacia integerrima TaxID=434235 RepID=A0ACC0X618_9ROSI|nr:hypothetical protein Pint_34618 [Pistacia integerrima]
MKMGLCSASWKVLLLLLVCVCRSGARKMKEESWKELGDSHQQNRKVPDESDYPVVDHHKIHPKEAIDPLSHMDHIDPSVRLFFKMNDLKLANIIPTYLPETDPSNSPHLFSREEADTIPFSLKDLPYLLDSFSYTHDSPQAKAMEDALRIVFGLKTDFEVLSTTHLIKSTATFQNYTILEEPKEISSPKMVACHTMPYPYAIFYCHGRTDNKLFKVSLGAEDGDRVEAVAVCHMDTSHWSPDHISFRLLGTKPGFDSHVCHFFPTDNLVFVQKSTL